MWREKRSKEISAELNNLFFPLVSPGGFSSSFCSGNGPKEEHGKMKGCSRGRFAKETDQSDFNHTRTQIQRCQYLLIPYKSHNYETARLWGQTNISLPRIKWVRNHEFWMHGLEGGREFGPANFANLFCIFFHRLRGRACLERQKWCLQYINGLVHKLGKWASPYIPPFLQSAKVSEDHG